MRHHALFAMPSIYETFGLVYIEALSQNLPIIYGKGQGVDQLFSEKESPVGIGVNAKSIEEIEQAIYTILNNQRNILMVIRVLFSKDMMGHSCSC